MAQSLAARPQIKDAAVEAWQQVRAAGKDDAVYAVAIDRFEAAPITTARGLVLKRDLLRLRQLSLDSGDTLSASGWARRRMIERTIDEGIEHLARTPASHPWAGGAPL